MLFGFSLLSIIHGYYLLALECYTIVISSVFLFYVLSLFFCFFVICT